MEIVTSRVLLRSDEPEVLIGFYRDTLGLPIAREYPGGVVFHAGNGLIEIPAHLTGEIGGSTDMLWLQVRDIAATHRELAAAGVTIAAAPETKPWGLIEMTVHDTDGRSLIVVQIPDDHPLRRDQRPPAPMTDLMHD
ncbi:MAG: VOC family protein [Gordonia sp. (in: high G+C Gram-positive bacteria)]|uniref:VOC family protein n=1 Tax=Gordonia sp. (in: high G+C Gram-positive bacteria) TaxID=84139 RepID=UPI0039E3E993